MRILELNFRLDELKEIEESEQELTIRYRPFGIGKLRLLVNMERSLLGFTDMGFQEKDIDDVKGLLVDTEMYILLMTFIVSGLSLPLILSNNDTKFRVRYFESHEEPGIFEMCDSKYRARNFVTLFDIISGSTL